MTVRVRMGIAVLTALAAASALVQAQGQPTAPKPVTPLRIEVTISRYDGEKKISSLPYLLTVNADSNGDRTSIRNGVNMTYRYGDKTDTTFVGTSIDCSATTTADGRYRLMLGVSDSSLYAPTATGKEAFPDPAAVRQFSMSDFIIVKDGQATPVATSVDKLSGETTRIDVTATAIK